MDSGQVRNLAGATAMATAALICVVVSDTFAERISLVAARSTLENSGVGAWAVRMTFAGLSALLIITTTNLIRHAAIATSVATIWLAVLATASLLLSPTGALSPFGQSDGFGPVLVWGPSLVAAVCCALIAMTRALAHTKHPQWADLVSLSTGIGLFGVASYVCARMVAGGWLAMKVIESPEKTAIRLSIFAAIFVIVFMRNLRDSVARSS